MTELQIGFVLFIATFLILFSGVPIAFGLVLISIIFLLIFGGEGDLDLMPNLFVNELTSFALLSIPLFVFLGAITHIVINLFLYYIKIRKNI